MKTYFILKDNVIDKKIKFLLDQMKFAKRVGVHELISSFIKFYAKQFTKGN